MVDSEPKSLTSAPFDDEESSDGSGEQTTAIVPTLFNNILPEAQVTPRPRLPEITFTELRFNSTNFEETTLDGTLRADTASAPLLVVVSVVAFLTIVVLFIGMIRYRFCKRASYYVNEMYEMDRTENGKKLLEEPSAPVVSVYNAEVKKEWLV